MFILYMHESHDFLFTKIINDLHDTSLGKHLCDLETKTSTVVPGSQALQCNQLLG